MAITVVVWNVRHFGDASDATRGANYRPICDFIAVALRKIEADIFIMMELRSGGGKYLETLRIALKEQSRWGRGQFDEWYVDYIPGSVKKKIPPVTQPDDLHFDLKGNIEGYAVFWRKQETFDVLPTRLNLSRGNTRGSRIGLVLEGRTSSPRNELGDNDWFHAPKFDPNRPPDPWQPLEFLEPGPVRPQETRWDRCRRPCYVVLKLKRATDRLLPIVVYHATANRLSTPWNVQSATYAADLYQVYEAGRLFTVKQAIAAGDFNIDHNDRNDWRFGAYRFFTDSFQSGGANLPVTHVDSRRSSENFTAVRLRSGPPQHPGPPIEGPNVDNYCHDAIDNLFTRGMPPEPKIEPVYNLLRELSDKNGIYSDNTGKAVIKSFHEAIETTLGPRLRGGGYENFPQLAPGSRTPCKTIQEGGGAGLVIYGLVDFDKYMKNLKNGAFAHDVRQAAEFYYSSISDHFPVVYRFPT